MPTHDEQSAAVHHEKLADIVGQANVLSGEDVPARHVQDLWGSDRVGQAELVVRPATARQVAQVLEFCHAHHQPVVVQGGMTGLVSGGVPARTEVVLSTELLTGMRVDVAAQTLVAQAGAVLGDAQRLAREHGLTVPIDLASRDSATLGGCVAQNAGGVNVVRHGMTRRHVRSLEVAFADGRLTTLSTPLVKDNAGMDLKQLFIGSEGVLGVVTSVTLALEPAMPARAGAFCAVRDVDAALALLTTLRQTMAGAVTAFEVMWSDAYEVLDGTGLRLPLPFGYPLYVLVECEGTDTGELSAKLVDCLARLDDRLLDTAVAGTAAELAPLWAARERIPSEVLRMQPLFGFDVSLPATRLEDAIARMRAKVTERWPAAKLLVFGHLGDDNVHIAVATGERDRNRKPEVEHIVYGVVADDGGSISAEHGVGFEKRDYLSYTRSADEIGMMRQLKHLFDPRGILNRGRLITWGEENV
ncbi:FAD-binding oxidoreductase [Amycolatopsis sp. cmx-11-12]|uniref:FAD-binding oxidoreductase n=1 Tax=Amycolatopsis sp. cmx-11-12 TaxID=2785795 RepID=UPI003916E53C